MAGSYDTIFRSIKTSTIWVEPPHVFKVWMMLLLSADREGVVEGSIPGLAAASVVTLEQCREAIGKFLAPDPESRTRDFEGRRIESIDGGWRILNYAKYQAKREHSRQAAAERKRAQRERDKSMSRVTECDVTQCHDSYLHTDTRTEEKKEREPEPVAAPAAPKQRAKAPGKTKAPEELEPTEATLAVARETGRNWRRDWEQCRDWAWGKGELGADWQARLRRWMRDNANCRGNSARREPPQPNNLEQPYKLNIL